MLFAIRSRVRITIVSRCSSAPKPTAEASLLPVLFSPRPSDNQRATPSSELLPCTNAEITPRYFSPKPRCLDTASSSAWVISVKSLRVRPEPCSTASCSSILKSSRTNASFLKLRAKISSSFCRNNCVSKSVNTSPSLCLRSAWLIILRLVITCASFVNPAPPAAPIVPARKMSPPVISYLCCARRYSRPASSAPPTPAAIARYFLLFLNLLNRLLAFTPRAAAGAVTGAAGGATAATPAAVAPAIAQSAGSNTSEKIIAVAPRRPASLSIRFASIVPRTSLAIARA